MGISRADADELWELITAYASDWATPKGTVPPSWMPSFVALSAFVDSLTVEPPTPAETKRSPEYLRGWIERLCERAEKGTGQVPASFLRSVLRAAPGEETSRS